jgi:hypothetical protein
MVPRNVQHCCAREAQAVGQDCGSMHDSLAQRLAAAGAIVSAAGTQLRGKTNYTHAWLKSYTIKALASRRARKKRVMY